MIHEDDRRTLEDWPEAKIITAKRECVLGNHYHKIKTEKFILVSGSGFVTIDGHHSELWRGDMITIKPGQMHSFSLNTDAVLIGLCSHPHDDSDVYT